MVYKGILLNQGSFECYINEVKSIWQCIGVKMKLNAQPVTFLSLVEQLRKYRPYANLIDDEVTAVFFCWSKPQDAYWIIFQTQDFSPRRNTDYIKQK